MPPGSAACSCSVALPHGDLYLERGLLGRAFETIRRVAQAHSYVIVTDHTVRSLHLNTLLSSFPEPPLDLAIPPGEAEKSRERWMELTDRMLDAACGRDTTVIALGGGVVGDLAGFLAATYMRGVPLVQIPTTLLAMVDASVGGKTAVDVPAGKNLVGAFHPPAVVLADPELLATLPARQARAGLAEMMKHGVIASREHFAGVLDAARPLSSVAAEEPAGRAAEPLDAVIPASVAIKAGVVSRDPLERGERRTLNFGHTIAHAVESALEYRLLHGEAVAIGMVAEARLAESIGVASPGLADEITEAVRSVSLPYQLPTGVELISWMRRDKKNQGGGIGFALPRRVGEMESADGEWRISVPVSELTLVLGG